MSSYLVSSARGFSGAARRTAIVLGVLISACALLAGTALAGPVRDEGETQTVTGAAGRAEVTFFTENDEGGFPVFNTTYGVVVKVFDTAKDDGCAYVNYSLIQPRTGDNEGDRVEACGTGKDSGDPKVFKDKPWFQHVSSPTGWKFQVCKKKRFRGDECGAWQYFDTKGNVVQS